MLCQPKPFTSCINPSEFSELTLTHLVALLQEFGKQKQQEQKQSGYAASYTAMLAAQKYRRDNNIPCPDGKDKVEFYGIWPFGESAS